MAQFEDQMIVSAELVSATLDTMGYNSDIVQYRRESWRKTFKEEKSDPAEFGPMRIVVGSKGEGLTSFAESDIDYMNVLGGVVCAEDVDTFKSGKTILFQLHHAISPGYARLSFISGFEKKPEVGTSSGDLLEKAFQRNLVARAGKSYLSNSFFLNENESVLASIMFKSERGPAISVGNITTVTTDTVFALRCSCSTFLNKWIERARNHDWPTHDTIRNVSSLEAHVVPVGFKLSADKDIEWRICYTLAEITLVHSFNDTQLKVYMLLKRIAKQTLIHLSPCITSYVIKNVMFWVSELIPLHRFSTDRLLDMLCECLRKLKEFIESSYIPCYMIPERTLLVENFKDSQRERLLSTIDELIDEGGRMLLRCADVRQAMVKMCQSPEDTRRQSDERDRMEQSAFSLIHKSQTIASVFPMKSNSNDGTTRQHTTAKAEDEIALD